ncbi:MAG TPA: divalent-cation tolerance protein CutA [Chroococcales cyanobacterium]
MDRGEIIVFVSCRPQEGERIACELVAEKLAACVNIIPGIKSIYRWKGEVCQETENLLIIKSHKAYWPRLEARIKELHSYEVPEIISVAIEDGSQDYLNWIRSQLEGAFR